MLARRLTGRERKCAFKQRHGYKDCTCGCCVSEGSHMQVRQSMTYQPLRCCWSTLRACRKSFSAVLRKSGPEGPCALFLGCKTVRRLVVRARCTMSVVDVLHAMMFVSVRG